MRGPTAVDPGIGCKAQFRRLLAAALGRHHLPYGDLLRWVLHLVSFYQAAFDYIVRPGDAASAKGLNRV
jgi:hypothetical protein